MSNLEALKTLDKAEDTLDNAIHNLEGGFTLGTVNRAYYTMFYCMCALLASVNEYAKTHQGTRSKFGELFIKTNVFPIYISKYIVNAFDLRQEADYDFEANITPEEAQILLKNAQEFFTLSKEYLKNKGQN